MGKRHTDLQAGKIPIHIKLETVPNAAISGGGGVFCHVNCWQEGPGRHNQILCLQISHLWRFHDLPYRGQCRLGMSILSGGLKAQDSGVVPHVHAQSQHVGNGLTKLTRTPPIRAEAGLLEFASIKGGGTFQCANVFLDTNLQPWTSEISPDSPLCLSPMQPGGHALTCSRQQLWAVWRASELLSNGR